MWPTRRFLSRRGRRASLLPASAASGATLIWPRRSYITSRSGGVLIGSKYGSTAFASPHSASGHPCLRRCSRSTQRCMVLQRSRRPIARFLTAKAS